MTPPTVNAGSRARAAGVVARLADLSSPLVAAGWYLCLTLALTWPLARGLARDVPADLGDSLLNCWILGWGGQHLLQLLSGDVGAIASFWNANIFYPEKLTLAYSEHLFAQVVQVLPVYALTRNLLLCYNLLFLSTFVLSGLGAYLLVRDLTGSTRAAFVAGLFYAFVPYRVAQFPHLQVLSSQWMPFVLFGMRRHFETRKVAPLAWATLALVAQNLSNGYFLIYFTPFICAYVLFEVWHRRRLGDWRQWLAIGASGAVVGLATWPFLAPYLELRALGAASRSLDEVQGFSANVFSYLTASPAARLAGRWFAAFMQPEGELFPGSVPILLALAAVAPRAGGWVRRRLRRLPLVARWRQVAAVVAAAVAGAHLAAAAVILLAGGINASLGPVVLRVTSLNRALLLLFLSLVGLRLATGKGSEKARDGVASLEVLFFAAAGLAAFWLSLGPMARTMWHRLDWGPYLLLYRYVPGFDGLRVPARFGMLVMLFLAILAGIGAADLDRRWRRGRLVLVALAAAFLIEGAALPIETNQAGSAPDLNPLPNRVFTGADVPPVYGFLARLPPKTVVMELPFGEIPYELQYMFYSTVHWHPLVNGFSGGFPASYLRRLHVLKRPLNDGEEAWRLVASAGVTHVVVHDQYFKDPDGSLVDEWLRRHGAVAVAAFGRDRVFEIR